MDQKLFILYGELDIKLKNKKVLKHILDPIIIFIISSFLAGSILVLLKTIVNYFYVNTSLNIVYLLVEIWNNFRFTLFGQFIDGVAFLSFAIVIYTFLSYRKGKNLVAVLEAAEEMANGNLEKVIEVNESDDIGKLANNINEIVTKLKDITIEEKRAQQTKTDLITNISHDLRTPLTSILGYLGLIDADQYKNEVELRHYMTIAYEKAKNLNIIINDLFELTKMQNSSIKLEKTEINLVEFLGQIISQFQYEFNSANMESRAIFSEDKLIIEADVKILVRAFENLITNALKYGIDGKYVDVVTEKEENMAVVKVINYGEEITSLDLPYIFERFYRVEKSRNKDSGGSGLGLAITKNIIELHNGNIKAYSNRISTIFEVKIPLK